MATRGDPAWSWSSEAELIARVIGGRPSPRLREVAAHLARARGNGIAGIATAELAAMGGLPAAHAAQLTALAELAERWHNDDRPAVTSPRDALLLFDGLRSARREQVAVLLLDARHRPLGLETVAVGTLNASRLQPRDVFGPALRGDAVAVIVGHNHPSGDTAPSRADRVVTAALRGAGDLLGVPVLDHLILARHGHHSFRDAEGWDAEQAA